MGPILLGPWRAILEPPCQFSILCANSLVNMLTFNNILIVASLWLRISDWKPGLKV